MSLRPLLPGISPGVGNLARRAVAPFNFARLDSLVAQGPIEAGAPTRRPQPALEALGPAGLERRLGKLFRDPEWEVEWTLA